MCIYVYIIYKLDNISMNNIIIYYSHIGNMSIDDYYYYYIIRVDGVATGIRHNIELNSRLTASTAS